MLSRAAARSAANRASVASRSDGRGARPTALGAGRRDDPQRRVGLAGEPQIPFVTVSGAHGCGVLLGRRTSRGAAASGPRGCGPRHASRELRTEARERRAMRLTVPRAHAGAHARPARAIGSAVGCQPGRKDGGRGARAPLREYREPRRETRPRTCAKRHTRAKSGDSRRGSGRRREHGRGTGARSEVKTAGNRITERQTRRTSRPDER